MHYLGVVTFLVVLSVVLGNDRCTPQGGTCQHDSNPCSGSYKSGFCPGSARIRCCLPADRCLPLGGTCQNDRGPCSGSYHSGFCPGSASNRCCMPAGHGWVDYRGFMVMDEVVRSKLQDIARYFGTRLWLTSGDRSGSGTSHHNFGKAADFWVDGGLSGSEIFDRIRSSGILNRDFQVIWHGTHTCTGGRHIHIGRYGDNRNTCWVHEGTTSSNVCDYVCM